MGPREVLFVKLLRPLVMYGSGKLVLQIRFVIEYCIVSCVQIQQKVDQIRWQSVPCLDLLPLSADKSGKNFWHNISSLSYLQFCRMREAAIVCIAASGLLAVTSYFYAGRPYLDRRRLRIAEEELKGMYKRKELSDASKSSETTDRPRWYLFVWLIPCINKETRAVKLMC